MVSSQRYCHYLVPEDIKKKKSCNLKRIISLYSRAGFIIQTILMDKELNKVVSEIPEVTINTSTASEHVATVERRIRIVKERC